jgi:hypothetical protein
MPQCSDMASTVTIQPSETIITDTGQGVMLSPSRIFLSSLRAHVLNIGCILPENKSTNDKQIMRNSFGIHLAQ